MQRILIVGSGGSGKSTLSKRLAKRTGLPVIHLDAHYWKPGWSAPSPAEWNQAVGDLVSGDAWIMDGNYGGTMDQRLEACDGVVFLDVPRGTCIRRLIKRRLRYRGGVRPEMTEGCAERLSLEFLLYVWRYPKSRRPGIMRRLKALSPSKSFFVLKTSADIEAFLEQVQG